MWPTYAGRGTQLSLLLYLSGMEGGEWFDRVQRNACLWLSIAPPDSIHAAASDCHKLREADKSVHNSPNPAQAFLSLIGKWKNSAAGVPG